MITKFHNRSNFSILVFFAKKNKRALNVILRNYKMLLETLLYLLSQSFPHNNFYKVPIYIHIHVHVLIWYQQNYLHYMLLILWKLLLLLLEHWENLIRFPLKKLGENYLPWNMHMGHFLNLVKGGKDFRFSATFINISVNIMAVSFIGKKPTELEKTLPKKLTI